MTQVETLLRYLRANPGASSLEITKACDIVNVTGRVSDARRDGIEIECRRRSWDGRDGYWIVEPGQRTLGLDAA